MLTQIILICISTNDLYMCYDWFMYCLDTTKPSDLSLGLKFCEENMPPELKK